LHACIIFESLIVRFYSLIRQMAVSICLLLYVLCRHVGSSEPDSDQYATSSTIRSSRSSVTVVHSTGRVAVCHVARTSAVFVAVLVGQRLAAAARSTRRRSVSLRSSPVQASPASVSISFSRQWSPALASAFRIHCIYRVFTFTCISLWSRYCCRSSVCVGEPIPTIRCKTVHDNWRTK